MPDLNQQFLGIVDTLGGDRAFRRHVRWTHAAVPVRRAAPLGLVVVCTALGLVVAHAVLLHLMGNLQALGGS